MFQRIRFTFNRAKQVAKGNAPAHEAARYINKNPLATYSHPEEMISKYNKTIEKKAFQYLLSVMLRNEAILFSVFLPRKDHASVNAHGQRGNRHRHA